MGEDRRPTPPWLLGDADGPLASGRCLKAEHWAVFAVDLWPAGGLDPLDLPSLLPCFFSFLLHSPFPGVAGPNKELRCKLLSQALLFREPR